LYKNLQKNKIIRTCLLHWNKRASYLILPAVVRLKNNRRIIGFPVKRQFREKTYANSKYCQEFSANFHQTFSVRVRSIDDHLSGTSGHSFGYLGAPTVSWQAKPTRSLTLMNANGTASVSTSSVKVCCRVYWGTPQNPPNLILNWTQRQDISTEQVRSSIHIQSLQDESWSLSQVWWLYCNCTPGSTAHLVKTNVIFQRCRQ
jgi:hypothetical protein